MSDTILDYLEKFGSKTFKRLPFGEVDALILSQFSYLKFDGIVPGPDDVNSFVTLSDIKNHPRFNDLFTDEELVDGFFVYNASWCLWEGLMPGAQPNQYAHFPLLINFLDEADQMIVSGKSGVRLRFGHDSTVLPFAYILGFKEAIGGTDDMDDLHNHFALFRLIPMAANIQLIFFRKQGSDDILVKFLMNENETSIPIDTDCYPFYHWKDAEAYYRNMLRDAHITYKTIIEKNEDD